MGEMLGCTWVVAELVSPGLRWESPLPTQVRCRVSFPACNSQGGEAQLSCEGRGRGEPSQGQGQLGTAFGHQHGFG